MEDVGRGDQRSPVHAPEDPVRKRVGFRDRKSDREESPETQVEAEQPAGRFLSQGSLRFVRVRYSSNCREESHSRGLQNEVSVTWVSLRPPPHWGGWWIGPGTNWSLDSGVLISSILWFLWFIAIRVTRTAPNFTLQAQIEHFFLSQLKQVCFSLVQNRTHKNSW